MTNVALPRLYPETAKDFYDLSGPDLLAYCGADASKWATAFCKIKEAQGWSANDIDEGLMISWFANAIEHSSQLRGLAQTSQDADRMRRAILGYLSVFDACGGSESVGAERFADARHALRSAVAEVPPAAQGKPDCGAWMTDEMVEIGARALWRSSTYHGYNEETLEHEFQRMAGIWRNQVRAILTAVSLPSTNSNTGASDV